jgi:hypothetical protein
VRLLTGDRPYRFLIDTGADFSAAPLYVAQQVGLTIDQMSDADIVGVGRGGMRAQLGALPLRIGDVELRVRCLFMDIESDAFILGRADFLERFALTIDARAGRIILTEFA